jgi:hypothetical protein
VLLLAFCKRNKNYFIVNELQIVARKWQACLATTHAQLLVSVFRKPETTPYWIEIHVAKRIGRCMLKHFQLELS